MDKSTELGSMALIFAFLDAQIEEKAAELKRTKTPKTELVVANLRWASNTLKRRLEVRV